MRYRIEVCDTERFTFEIEATSFEHAESMAAEHFWDQSEDWKIEHAHGGSLEVEYVELIGASTEHHYEMWRREVDGVWGWQCFTCGAHDEGFDGFKQAETAGDAFHRQVST